MAEQLSLPYLRSARLPFAVRRRAIGRAMQRELSAYAASLESKALRSGFAVRSLIEDEALLAELRQRCRVASRKSPGRSGSKSSAVFVSTLEGYRVHRLMDELSARITQRQETLLCG